MHQPRHDEEIVRPATDSDHEDLLQVLTLRFGEVPNDVRALIAIVQDGDRMDHLILAAANAPGWEEFLQDLSQPAFRMVGTDYDPLRELQPPAKKGVREI